MKERTSKKIGFLGRILAAAIREGLDGCFDDYEERFDKLEEKMAAIEEALKTKVSDYDSKFESQKATNLINLKILLEHFHYHYVIKKEELKEIDFSNICKIYDCYKFLGGNSEGDQYFKEISERRLK